MIEEEKEWEKNKRVGKNTEDKNRVLFVDLLHFLQACAPETIMTQIM